MGKVFPFMVFGPSDGDQPFVVALRLHAEDSSPRRLPGSWDGPGVIVGDHPTPVAEGPLRLVRDEVKGPFHAI